MNSTILYALIKQLEALGAPDFSVKNNAELAQYIANRLPELADAVPGTFNRLELDFLAKTAWAIKPDVPFDRLMAKVSQETRVD